MIHRTYMNKANRDAEFKRLGGKGMLLRRSSMRNQLMHPQHVLDYTQVTGRILSEADCGFGNSIYQTYFSVIYTIDDDARSSKR